MGHPSPDLPGDIQTLVGGECEVVLVLGSEFNGVTKPEVKYFNSLAVSTTQSTGDGEDVKPNDMDDEIPF